MNAGLTRLDMLQDKEESIIATNKLDHCSHDSDDGPSNHPGLYRWTEKVGSYRKFTALTWTKGLK